jgi:hypothetical protein
VGEEDAPTPIPIDPRVWARMQGSNSESFVPVKRLKN